VKVIEKLRKLWFRVERIVSYLRDIGRWSVVTISLIDGQEVVLYEH
jgi:hypothetical protein